MYTVGDNSVADVPSGGWERKGGSLPCTSGCAVTHVPSVGEERRISAMYGGRSVADVPSGG